MEQKTLRAEDGYKLDLHIFETENARGCVQIIHGMEEHKERYDAFAQELQKAGFTVVSSDMRGHGVGAPELGFLRRKMDISCFCLIRSASRITSESVSE